MRAKEEYAPLMKIPLRSSSLIAAIFFWLLLSGLAVFIFWAMRDRARLIRDNENERLFNMLFTELRDYDDFGSAIENNPALRERIAGFGVYDDNHGLLYSWGRVPPGFDEGLLGKDILRGRFGRYTIPDKKGNSVKFVLRAERPPPPHRGESSNWQQPPIFRQGFPFFNTLFRGSYYYVDISHPAYWRTVTVTTILLPLCFIAFLVLVFYIRRLYLRNREYRERIEAQKNLVVLGAAAGTLAHEIKNPLLSIRLQTGILRKVFSGQGRDELSIIEEEVDRLSELTYRVNDYLREAEGNPQPVDCAAVLAETGRRLCGREILAADSLQAAPALMDPERLRSVFENVVRNALEAGGPPEEIRASISRSGGSENLVITLADRGQGVAEGDRGRVFDLFFTRKSAGTGIGLSISKRFVEAAGGTIELENREGGGALVRICLKEDYTSPG